MKGMVFAAGLGTRLKPFTLSHPKALVEVGGEPMLKRVICKLRDAGISEIVVNVHHFASQITEYLKSNDNFGADIHISDESNLLLDTGGGISHASRWLEGDDFVVHNADILTDFPISSMINYFYASDSDAVLLTDKRDTSRYLLFDAKKRMHGWTNIKTGELRPVGLVAQGLTPLAFGGVHVISHRILPLISQYAAPATPFSIIDFYISNCRTRRFSAFTPEGKYLWHDIGKPESLEKAQAAISQL